MTRAQFLAAAMVFALTALAPHAVQGQAAEGDSLLAAARAASARGQHAEAWRALRAAYDPARDDARVLALLAGAAATAGDMTPFRALLDSVVREDGGPHALEYWTALALDGGIPPDTVLAVIEARLDARAVDVAPLLGLVRVLRAHHQGAPAAALLERAAARGTDPALLAVALGDARLDQGDAAGALDAWLGAAGNPEAADRARALLAARPPGYEREPLLARLWAARDEGREPAARLAAQLLAELESAAGAPPLAADPPEAHPLDRAPLAPDDAVAAASDTTALAAALAARGPGADSRLVALRAGDLWLARGVPDSAVAAYARAVDRGAAPELGPAALEALARIRLVRALAGLARGRLASVGLLAVQSEGDPAGAAAALDALAPALGLADSAPATPLVAALAAEWRGRAGDPAGASAALEAAAGSAGGEAAALLLAAGRWALAASDNERARTLLRAVVEEHAETPYALEARRLLAGEPAGG